MAGTFPHCDITAHAPPPPPPATGRWAGSIYIPTEPHTQMWPERPSQQLSVVPDLDSLVSTKPLIMQNLVTPGKHCVATLAPCLFINSRIFCSTLQPPIRSEMRQDQRISPREPLHLPYLLMLGRLMSCLQSLSWCAQRLLSTLPVCQECCRAMQPPQSHHKFTRFAFQIC
jgi:hypothetical protein